MTLSLLQLQEAYTQKVRLLTVHDAALFTRFLSSFYLLATEVDVVLDLLRTRITIVLHVEIHTHFAGKLLQPGEVGLVVKMIFLGSMP